MASDRRADGRAGSRRIFPPRFKLEVLDAYRRDPQCRGNQRATARKFGIHRRQIQKWLQAEPTLRAALLRRAPQPAPSPPPYAAGSPESARLPSPSPPAPACCPQSAPRYPQPPQPSPTRVPHSPVELAPYPAAAAVAAEPIDLSLKRTLVEERHPLAPSPPSEEPQRKPFKLFRPYLLDERPAPPARASAFVAVGGCALAAACPPVCRYPSFPSFPAPLR